MSNLILNSHQLLVLQQIELTKQHRLRPESQSLMHLMSPRMYWKEIGATISILPRGVGKTTLCNYLREQLVNSSQYVTLANPRTDKFQITFTPNNRSHLIIDEYKLINQEILDSLLNQLSWTSVLMIGSEY